MAGFWDRLKKGITGEAAAYDEYDGSSMAANYKNSKDLYKEGADVSARMGNEAAAQAGANAKANAMMNGGSKMTAALMGAQAANQAGANTFNSQLGRGAELAGRQNAAQAQAKNQAAQANVEMKNQKAQAEQQTATNRWEGVLKGIGSAAAAIGKSIFS